MLALRITDVYKGLNITFYIWLYYTVSKSSTHLKPYVSKRNLKNGGKIIEPRALPEIAMPLARPLSRTKYEVTINTPGGNESPAPRPTRMP